MKRQLPIALMAFIVLLFSACVPKGPQDHQDNDSTVVKTDSVPVLEASDCGNLQPGQFCVTGLDILKVGDSLTWNEKLKPSLEGAVFKDTIFEEPIAEPIDGDSTVAWFVKIMRFADGDIFMEAGSAAAGQDAHLLNRVQIHTSTYSLPSGLKVGSTAKELKEIYPKAYVTPFESFGVMEILVPFQQGRLFFHVPMEGIFSPSKADYNLSDIPDNTKIKAIVVM
jgi:hypothetical protein